MSLADEEFINIWRELGGARAVSKRLQISERATHSRRCAVEDRTGTLLSAISGTVHIMPEAPKRIHVNTPDGIHTELDMVCSR